MSPIIKIYKNPVEFSRATAEEIVAIIQKSLSESNRFTLALAGGNTPKSVYAFLKEQPLSNQIEWHKVHLFWGDERNVPPEHEESNYRMVQESLLRKITIPALNVHRIRGELQAKEAAQAYELELQNFFHEKPPVFDLILLGVGEDGHTASLFPGTGAVDEKEKLVTAVFVPRLNSWRITLTLPVLNAAKNVMFIVAGASKAKVVAQILKTDQPQKSLPASLVHPLQGTLYWMLDEQASKFLDIN